MHKDLLAKFGHDAKNPLGAVKGYLSLLVRELEEGSKTEQMAQSALGAVTDLEKIINSFLDYSSPLILNKVPFDLKDIITSAISELGGKVKFENQSELGEVVCDPQRLKEAITHLISRAEDEITLSVKEQPKCYQLEIDHSFESMDLFDPLSSQSRGLGIALAKKIIEGHQGKLECHLKKFLIEIPKGC